jgi:hypothetical protein
MDSIEDADGEKNRAAEERQLGNGMERVHKKNDERIENDEAPMTNDE